MYSILTKQLLQDLLLSRPSPLLCSLCSTTTPLNWDLSPSISVFTGIIGMRPNSAILDVSGRIKLCQVCESGFQFQFLQSSGNLSLVHSREDWRILTSRYSPNSIYPFRPKSTSRRIESAVSLDDSYPMFFIALIKSARVIR